MENECIMPCPFCGMVPGLLSVNSRYYIKCPSCSLLFGFEEGVGAVFSGKMLLKELWNTRKSAKKGCKKHSHMNI